MLREAILPGSAAALTPARKSQLSTPLMKKAEAPGVHPPFDELTDHLGESAQ